MLKTLAHVSDLHFGASQNNLGRAYELVRALLTADIDHVVVTGDVTDGGRGQELAAFERAFAPLRELGRLTVVPGNHDRLGDDVGAWFMSGKRVDTVELPGAFLVRVDSTGPHNRTSILAGHGDVCQVVLEEICAALDQAPAGALVAILLHHHPIFLPEEGFWEKVASIFNLPFAAELSLGEEILRRALGRCDLILHGHRHVPSARILCPASARPLRVYNAGCSTARGGMNVFTHDGGLLLDEPRWLQVSADTPGFLEIPPYERAEYELAV